MDACGGFLKPTNVTACVLTDVYRPVSLQACFSRRAFSPSAFYADMLCLNRKYACRHGYQFIVASAPHLDLVDADRSILSRADRQQLTGLCNGPGFANVSGSSSRLGSPYSLRSKTWCKVRQLQLLLARAQAGACDVIVWMDADALLKPSAPGALLSLRIVQAWLHSASVLAVPREPPGVNGFKSGSRNNWNNTAVTTGFMLLKGDERSRYMTSKILKSWWVAVEPTLQLKGSLGEPLWIYRSEWAHEQRVLDDYVRPRWKGNRTLGIQPLVTLIGTYFPYPCFNTPDGRVVAHYWFKDNDANRYKPFATASNPIGIC